MLSRWVHGRCFFAILLIAIAMPLPWLLAGTGDLGSPAPHAAKEHWAFRKPIPQETPSVQTREWIRNGIDPFVLSKLETQRLTPAPQADRYTLARRLALDLTGLPPTPDEVDAFVNDTSPEAYNKIVEHFINSPAYGERWARLWLDLARYADSKGYGSDPLRPYMWRYRDWVIDAFNRNLSYDQFTLEQLAGDLLPHPTTDQILATAFHRNTMANDEGGTDDEEFRVAAIKDRVDTTLQVWMGLTFGCAKCHSHKYDPISQRDYYAFYALFNQTADADRTDDSPRYPTPTPEQALRLQELATRLKPLREHRDHPNLALTPQRTEWEERERTNILQWIPLPPTRALAGGGTELRPAPDDSLLATGPNPATNLYTVEFDRLPGKITALRLELMPTPAADRLQLGRGKTGAVQVHDLKLVVQSPPQLQRARFVRIDLPGKNRFLSLAEVQVMSGGTNIALVGTASQSSTDLEGAADRANDGNVNGNYQQRSVTHTKQSENPWWELDLGTNALVEKLVIWNRSDNNLDSRLDGYQVSLLSDRREAQWTERFPKAPTPSEKIDFTGSHPVLFTQVSASAEDAGSSIQQAVDRDPLSAWRITQTLDHPQEAVFQFLKPIDLKPGAHLVLTIDQSAGGEQTLAHFRCWASLERDPASALPWAVRDALAVETKRRSAAENAAIAGHYWKLSPEYRVLKEEVQPLEDQFAALEREVIQTPVLQELSPDRQRQTRILQKGNFLSPGEPVSPAAPAAFHAWPAGSPTNRLGVAHWLMSPENPLTARVAVNRFWSALFSKGLVESEEDFGTQGTLPSHPELLDWLATEFESSHWDIKQLLRLMVQSATYQQSAATTPEKLQRDPRNRWLSHAARPRLEAEMVRDQALALSGLLSAKRFGPSVFPPQPTNLWQTAFNADRTWASSEGEDKHRRSLYTFWRRTVPYPSMVAFDAPSREYCTVRRIPSNTPLQAFVTLNDPVFVEAAQALARRILSEGGATPDTRIRWALKLALARPAEERQVAVLLQLYQNGLKRFENDPTAASQLSKSLLSPTPERWSEAEAAAWTVVANILLNLDAVLTKG